MNPSKVKFGSYKLERLDTGDFTPQEYELWKKEMQFIHRFLGERRAIRQSLVAEIRKNPADQIKVLDVGAGSGELSAGLVKTFPDLSIFIVGADTSEFAVRSMRANGIHGVQCNALEMPFADNSFDYVYCTLFLHHLTDRDAVELLGQMNRIARQKIFVIDLERQYLAYLSFKIFGRLFLQSFTREDGALSILRAFNPTELKDIAAKAGVKNISVRRSYLNRLILSGTS